MPAPLNVTNTAWQATTVGATAEVWQAVEGAVALSCDATPAADQGTILRGEKAIEIAGGKTVYYRLLEGSRARVTRESFK